MNTPNPYSPPPHEPPIVRGEPAPVFGIFDVLGEAWTLTQGCKAQFLLVYLGVFVVMWLLQLVLGSVFGAAVAANASMLGTLVWQLLLAAAIYPFLAGVMRLALRRADGYAVQAGDAFGHGVRIVDLALLGVLLTVATIIGFSLLLLPGIYLSVALMFALPLMVDRKLGAVDALKTSLRAVNPHWFRCAGLLCVLGVVLALAAVTVIGLVWALPVTSIALAVAYRRFFPAPVVASPASVDAG